MVIVRWRGKVGDGTEHSAVQCDATSSESGAAGSPPPHCAAAPYDSKRRYSEINRKLIENSRAKTALWHDHGKTPAALYMEPKERSE